MQKEQSSERKSAAHNRHITASAMSSGCVEAMKAHAVCMDNRDDYGILKCVTIGSNDLRGVMGQLMVCRLKAALPCLSFSFVPRGQEKLLLYSLVYDRKPGRHGVRAQYMLGVLQEGIGVAKDLEEAVRLYRLAADQGHADAQNGLGICYRKGIGVAKDMKKRCDCTGSPPTRVTQMRSATSGCATRTAPVLPGLASGAAAGSPLTRARCAVQPRVVPPERLWCCQGLGRGVHLYWLAADQGHAQAQCNLGWCYDKGSGAKDSQEAVRLYCLAADQGNAWAQFNLGWCYQNGCGICKDASGAAVPAR